MRVKELDSFASGIKEAKKKRKDIFIVRPYQTIILYVKPDIKIRYLNLFQDNFMISEVKYNKRDLFLNVIID